MFTNENLKLKKEVRRYLGYGQNIPDDRVEELIEICIKEVEAAANPKSIHRRFDVHISFDDYIEAAGLRMHSSNLARNLKGCEEVVFFAATLGMEVDRLLSKYIKLDMAKAAVVQATAAAVIEQYCNTCQHVIEEEVAKEGLYVRPRFSPGYGDLDLAIQPQFLSVINATKIIGITLSDGGIMLPEKSVSAVMGLSRVNSRCHIEGCEICGKTNCIYKR